MNDWMRRRIERSRARCDKSAADHRPSKQEEATKQPSPQAPPAPAQATAS